MDRSPFIHVLTFLYLCGVVSLILSCYRQEDTRTILRETARRTVKFVAFIALLAIAAYAIERFTIDS